MIQHGNLILASLLYGPVCTHTLYITEESICVRPQVLSIYLEESIIYLDKCCVNSPQIYEARKEVYMY
jgi:hypothetical protein